MAKTIAWMTSAADRGALEAATMTSTILTYLLQYENDGEYSAEPLTIEAQVVEDERNGIVLEIPLPADENQDGERVVQIPLQQLRRSLQKLT
jgi:hypothetical protein